MWGTATRHIQSRMLRAALPSRRPDPVAIPAGLDEAKVVKDIKRTFRNLTNPCLGVSASARAGYG